MRYKAFISYSHKDERWGARLHKRLETFRIPRRIIGQITGKGEVPAALKPVFRDKVELSAGANLSEALQRRLEESETLIVLCSPNSAKSFWVNEEILYFKRHNNPDNIFAFIIDGEPHSGAPEQECFPEALRFELDPEGQLTDQRADPLAADARKQSEGERAALLRLVSGMLGVGFDDLVRRDLQRARRRVTGITATAISAMLVMGTLTGIALDARSEAEARKNDAEGLIEFMLTDLRDKLEPVGRLDALDAVGQKASEYYNQYDLDNLDPDTMGRYATVNHLLGDIQLRMGNISEAKKYFDPVFETTQGQLEANPNNPDRIYEHIQSVFWVAQPAFKEGQFEIYQSYQLDYLNLAKKLHDIEGDTDRALQEMAYGYSNVGHSWFKLKNYKNSDEFLLASITFYDQAVARLGTIKSKIERSRRYSEIATNRYKEGEFTKGFKWESKRKSVLEVLLNEHSNDFQVIKESIWSDLSLSDYHFQFEDFIAAKELLTRSHNLIERGLHIEPSDEELLRLNLVVLSRLKDVERKLYRFETAKTYADKVEALIIKRLNNQSGLEFDRKWDYEEPLKFIREEQKFLLLSGKFREAAELLHIQAQLLENIKNKPNFKSEWNTNNIRYLTSKALLTNDHSAYLNLRKLLQQPENKNDLNHQILMITLLDEKFCFDRKFCFSTSYEVSDSELDGFLFSIFEKQYPNFAHAFKSKLNSKGDEVEND